VTGAVVKARAGVWLRRYLPAEVVSLVGALVAANVGWWLTDNAAVAAVAAAWGETGAYYATMRLRELSPQRRPPLLVGLRNQLLEFGVAEALDSLFIRPALMYAAGQLVSDRQLGTVVGKLGADVFFYLPTIAAYELRTRCVPSSAARP
jgi:hypothetical protein